jgi:cholesterol oxidase
MKRTHNAAGELRPLHASRGPVITSAIRIPDELEGGGPGRGFYIQDCGYPMILNWALETSGGLFPRLLRFAVQRLWADLTSSPKSQLGPDLRRLLGDGGAASSTMPLLGIGRDIPDGRMSLRSEQYLAVDWSTKTSKGYFDRVHATMLQVSKALNATRLGKDPWTYVRRTITVHPLGGAPMGTHRYEGVCDGFGEVFGYDNLFVADGAAMPGPTGANPALTIAAFSDRMCTAILQGRCRGANGP